MRNANQYHTITPIYTQSRVLEAAYVLTAKVSFYIAFGDFATETNTLPKKVVAEKVNMRHFYFLNILTTPEGDIKDLTDVDDRTPNFWHESQWASIPHPCFDANESLLNPIWQGALAIQAKSRGLVHHFINRRERMIFEGLEADMAKRSAAEAKLKVEEQAMIARLRWKWTLRGRGKQTRKFLDLIS